MMAIIQTILSTEYTVLHIEGVSDQPVFRSIQPNSRVCSGVSNSSIPSARRKSWSLYSNPGTTVCIIQLP